MINRSEGLAAEGVTRSIIGAFFEVYNHLGEGFLESVYSAALTKELGKRGHAVVTELRVRIQYKGEFIAWHRLDMVIDDQVVIEIKSTETLHPRAKRQLRNYLRATKFEVGLLFHFGEKAQFFREYSPNSLQ